jgi:hypothetical protein
MKPFANTYADVGGVLLLRLRHAGVDEARVKIMYYVVFYMCDPGRSQTFPDGCHALFVSQCTPTPYPATKMHYFLTSISACATVKPQAFVSITNSSLTPNLGYVSLFI